MPIINVRRSLAANEQVDNLFTGSAFEYLPSNAGVEMGVVALSGALGDVVADVSSGADILAENSPVTVRAAGINLQDDLYWEDFAAAGDRLKMRVRNTTAGVIIVQAFARISPL